MKFELPTEQSSIIKVIGVGGGGSNAVNTMYKQGIKGVDFIVCNTDQQALDISPVPIKIQLGSTLTEGRGAGSLPEVGKNAAIENIDEIKAILANNTKMVFITAGMGGGTGTGAAPVIAQAAKELGILTVGIVTVPFTFEGKKRKLQAEGGIEEMRKNVDTLLIICNERLREMYGNLDISHAFSQADSVLTTAAKGIAEIITVTGFINVDFADVCTVMTNSGVAIMGSSLAEGEDRAMRAVEQALASPLLNDNNIQGARYVLINITYGTREIQMDEVSEITDYVQDAAGMSADVIWGHGHDETLGDNVSVTVIATGFNQNPNTGHQVDAKPQVKVMKLEDNVTTSLTQPLASTSKVMSSASLSTDSQKAAEPYLKSNSDNIKDKPLEELAASQKTVEFNLTSASQDKPKKEDKINDPMEPFIVKPKEKLPEPVNWNKPVVPTLPPVENKPKNEITPEDQHKKVGERMSRLREFTLKLRGAAGVGDLENEPAYKRRNIQLDDVTPSSESEVSRYTLSEETGADGEKRVEIKSNNSFLHDNVD